jgi:hypothetical protein
VLRPELVNLYCHTHHTLALKHSVITLTAVVHFVNLKLYLLSSPGSSVLGHKSGGHLKGLSLLLLDAGK